MQHTKRIVHSLKAEGKREPARLDWHPVALKVQIDDILHFAHATATRFEMLQDFAPGSDLERLAHTAVKAVRAYGSTANLVAL